MARATVAGMLARACGLGCELHAIAADTGLQRLSRNAWLGMAAELAGGAVLAELRTQVEALPYLARLCSGTAQHWLRTGQDRPVPEPVFGDGDNYPAAYAERLHSGVSVEEASAVAAVICAELMPAAAWGRLNTFDEVPALTEPLRAELAQLDQQLRGSLLVADLRWDAGRPVLTAGDVTVEIGPGNVSDLASAFAVAAAQRHAATARAEAA